MKTRDTTNENIRRLAHMSVSFLAKTTTRVEFFTPCHPTTPLNLPLVCSLWPGIYYHLNYPRTRVYIKVYGLARVAV